MTHAAAHTTRIRLGQLIIRADESAAIGTGHVMRCLALAQAWQDSGGHANIITSSALPALQDRLESEGVKVLAAVGAAGTAEDAMHTLRLSQEIGAIWVVIDGYHFGAQFQKVLHDAGLHVLVVDDYGHAAHYFADVVLNPNVFADQNLYRDRERYTRLLLGAPYNPLRREFQIYSHWRHPIADIARKLLVTFGGSDNTNVSLKVVQAVKLITDPALEIKVVVGGMNSNCAAFEAESNFYPHRIEFCHDVSAMSELMAWADIAVSASGSTSWEIAFMGLPAIVIATADNQSPIAQHLDSIGVSSSLGRHLNVSATEIASELQSLIYNKDIRDKMSRSGHQLVDGGGAQRVVKLLSEKSIRLRPALESDLELLWKWVNDPVLREASFNSTIVPWNEHVHWFNAKLKAIDALLLVAEDAEKTSLGQVRFEIQGNEAVISIMVDQLFRNLGYGTTLVLSASQYLFQNRDVTLIHAYIKPDNQASLHCFQKAGYSIIGATYIKNSPAQHLALKKNSP